MALVRQPVWEEPRSRAAGRLQALKLAGLGDRQPARAIEHGHPQHGLCCLLGPGLDLGHLAGAQHVRRGVGLQQPGPPGLVHGEVEAEELEGPRPRGAVELLLALEVQLRAQHAVAHGQQRRADAVQQLRPRAAVPGLGGVGPELGQQGPEGHAVVLVTTVSGVGVGLRPARAVELVRPRGHAEVDVRVREGRQGVPVQHEHPGPEVRLRGTAVGPGHQQGPLDVLLHDAVPAQAAGVAALAMAEDAPQAGEHCDAPPPREAGVLDDPSVRRPVELPLAVGALRLARLRARPAEGALGRGAAGGQELRDQGLVLRLLPRGELAARTEERLALVSAPEQWLGRSHVPPVV
mmetsp:Transcript_92869/g.300342  ORF Transcript_92869/g.300342 Transcript_92869/m.300342 type:complete len:349 (-) Transcript_92869:400-1446(-)